MEEQIHDKKRLKELQALPLERKIGITQTRITEFLIRMEETGKNPVVNFSGGKDSTVLLYLAIGTMAEESSLRAISWTQTGCNSLGQGKEKSRPMSFWTKQDVLEFLRWFEIPYCQKIYGDIVEEKGKLKVTGEPRTGCIFCPIGCHLEEPNKFQRLRETHPKQHKYVIESLGLGDFLDELNISH